MAPAGVIIALSGQAVAPARRAFGRGVFYTICYAIMTAAPPVAERTFDQNGGAKGAIVFAACLVALVPPVALRFGKLTTTPRGGILQEGV